MVTYAQSKEEQFYVDLSKKELVELGISEIATFNLTNEKFDTTQKFDVIYVCGGNTFAILDRIRVTGLDGYITRFVSDGEGVYVGVSAGSIVAGPSIEIAGWGSEGDENKIGLTDLEGLKLTDVSVYPHFRGELKGEVEEFRKKVSYPVVELTDDEAVFVDDKKLWKILNQK
jgi:dipeptidase E